MLKDNRLFAEVLNRQLNISWIMGGVAYEWNDLL